MPVNVVPALKRMRVSQVIIPRICGRRLRDVPRHHIGAEVEAGKLVLNQLESFTRREFSRGGIWINSGAWIDLCAVGWQRHLRIPARYRSDVKQAHDNDRVP